MDNALVNAFIPLVVTILTEAIQVVVEVIKGRQWREVRWARTAMVTTAAAVAATAFIFMIISNTTRCGITNLGWIPYMNDKTGSTIIVNPEMDAKCAFQVSFDLKKERAFVAAYKKLEPRFLAWWVKGIEFSYSGMGSPNTIELKLFDIADNQYKVVLQNASNTDGRTVSVTVPYEDLTSASTGQRFQRNGFELDRIDFTFSNWTGDTPGAGNVIIHNIRIFLTWHVWLLVLSPLLILALAGGISWWRSLTSARRSVYVDGL